MTRTRLILVVTLMAIGAAVGVASTLFSPTLYASSSTLMMFEQRVPEEYVRGGMKDIDSRYVVRLKQQILTRTRLERLITDFKLYDAEPMSQRMDDAVKLMRDRIVMESVGDAVTVAFVDPEPKVALRVTEKLASYLVDEQLRDREMTAENTSQFLKSQLDDVAKRIDETESRVDDARRKGRVPQALQLDFETLQARYRALRTMAEDARMSSGMERRQIGQQLIIIDPARVSEQPLAQGRHSMGLLGGGIGLLAGLGLAFSRPRG